MSTKPTSPNPPDASSIATDPPPPPGLQRCGFVTRPNRGQMVDGGMRQRLINRAIMWGVKRPAMPLRPHMSR